MRRVLLVLLLLAASARAGDWRRWPTRQLVESGLEWQCELIGNERYDYSSFLRSVASERPNDVDLQAIAAALLADAPNRRRGRDLDDARALVEAAAKLDPERPLVHFARASLAAGEARRAATNDKRSAFFAEAEAELATVASTAVGSLGFYARVSRTAIAFDRGDLDSVKRFRSEAIVFARPANVAPELVHRFRVVCSRKLSGMGAVADLLRESRWLERTRAPRLRRSSRSWTDADESARGWQSRWTTWALVLSGGSEEGRARAHQEIQDPWLARLESQALLDLRDPARALAAARRARNLEASHASEELVARALVALGRFEDARGVVEHALRLPEGAGCPRCLGELARIELLAGNDARGERLLARAEREDDGSPEVLAARSVLAAKQGDLATANELGARAFGPRPREDARAIERDSDAYRSALDQGQLEHAQEIAAGILARRPRSQRAIRTLAEITSRRGDPRAPFLLESLDATQDPWVLLERGKERARRGQLEDARRDLARSVALRCYPVTPAEQEALHEAKRALAGVEQALRPRVR